jgi:hypothetical protein
VDILEAISKKDDEGWSDKKRRDIVEVLGTFTKEESR